MAFSTDLGYSDITIGIRSDAGNLKSPFTIVDKDLRMNESKLVYSTETGRMCPTCGRPRSKCACQKKKAKTDFRKESDGVIRIRRESKGRKGKTVTTISGFQEKDAVLREIASDLKNRCGTGGSYKAGIIMLQGDHRETVKAELTKQGFAVKIAGG